MINNETNTDFNNQIESIPKKIGAHSKEILLKQDDVIEEGCFSDYLKNIIIFINSLTISLEKQFFYIIIFLCSDIATLCYSIFQIYILYYTEEEELMYNICWFLLSSLGFGIIIINSIIWKIFTVKRIPKLLLFSYILIVTTQILLSFLLILSISDSGKKYIVTIVSLMLMSMGLPGIFIFLVLIGFGSFMMIFVVEQFYKNILGKNDGSIIVKYNAYFYDENSFKHDNCVICLNDYHKNDIVCITQCQDHVFHENCIMNWINVQTICPICRSTIAFK